MGDLTKQTGLLYLELCLVVFLLSLLFTIFAPIAVQAYHREQTRTIVQRITNDLYFASNLARARQSIVYFDIFYEPGRYILSSPYFSERRQLLLPAGYHLESNFSRDRVTFNGKGLIPQGGTITLQSPDGHVYRFIIQLVTGRFRISYE